METKKYEPGHNGTSINGGPKSPTGGQILELDRFGWNLVFICKLKKQIVFVFIKKIPFSLSFSVYLYFQGNVNYFRKIFSNSQKKRKNHIILHCKLYEHIYIDCIYV